MNIQLTRNADKFLCITYKIYLQRRKNGISISEAKRFSKDFLNSCVEFYQWLPSDIDEARMELGRNKLIQNCVGTGLSILDEGIIYMENRFKNGLIEVTDFISKFI